MTTVKPPMTTQRRWQVGLVLFGLALLAVGGVTLLNDVNPKRYIGIATWFVGALILHDGIGALIVFGVSVGLRKVGRRIPFGVLAIVQGALAIGTIFAALVLPEVVKRAIGSANPTILPLDYLPNLGLFYAGLAVVTAATIAGYLAVAARRQKLRPSLDHD